MSALSLEALTTSLERGMSSLYLVHGEETLLALEATDHILLAARQHGFHEREVLTVEAGFDWSCLNEAMTSISLFATLKVLEIRIPGGKPGVEGAEALMRLAAHPPEDTVTVVSLPKLERSQQQSKWFQALERSAIVFQANPVSRAELPAWVSRQLKAQGQTVQHDALCLLVDRVEGNLLAARQEIDKLSLLYPKGELTFDYVREAVADVARYDVFHLSESWLAADIGRTVRMLDGLEAEGCAVVLVLWSFTEDIRMLLRLRQGLKAGRQIRDLTRELRLWGQKLKLAEPALRRLGARRLMAYLADCARIDRQIKGVAPGEAWSELKKLGVQLAR